MSEQIINICIDHLAEAEKLDNTPVQTFSSMCRAGEVKKEVKKLAKVFQLENICKKKI